MFFDRIIFKICIYTNDNPSHYENYDGVRIGLATVITATVWFCWCISQIKDNEDQQIAQNSKLKGNEKAGILRQDSSLAKKYKQFQHSMCRNELSLFA